MDTKKVIGIEFFSGIGAWKCGMPSVEFIPFEINEKANSVYYKNHNVQPIVKNLASIKPKDVPDAFIWCLSPPCQPFSSQKSSKNNNLDHRNDAIYNLINMIPVKKPSIIVLENVANFKDSNICDFLKTTLISNNYCLDEIILCPSQFGVPNRRNRYFLVATLNREFTFKQPEPMECSKVSNYISDQTQPDCFLPNDVLQKYFQVSDIKKPNDTMTNCFTKNYFRYVEGTGSLLQTKLIDIDMTHVEFDAQKYNLGLRRFSPIEISKLFGFPHDFELNVPIKDQYKLLGNSINIHVVKYIYSQIKHLLVSL